MPRSVARPERRLLAADPRARRSDVRHRHVLRDDTHVTHRVRAEPWRRGAGGPVVRAHGAGSAALALGVALLPARFALRWRWLAFAGVLSASALGYATLADAGSIVVWLLLMGLGVGPTLVTLFSLAGMRAPAGRAATTMTLLGSALTLAQALASAVTGWIADELGVGVAMALPAVAAVVVLALGVVNAAGERRHAAVRRVSAA
ncbi:MAG: hypothetical protein U0Q04_01235 [Microbacterium sp.]